MKAGPITVGAQYERSNARGDAPVEVPGSSEWSQTEGIIQPSVVWLGGVRLRLFARSTSRIGRICVADSYDRGVSWTEACPIDLPCPNSGLDALTLRDGRIVLVHNGSDQKRTPLNLAVSSDGEHFLSFMELENLQGEYSYPAVIQDTAGDLHLTYTWKRERIRHVSIPLNEIPGTTPLPPESGWPASIT